MDGVLEAALCTTIVLGPAIAYVPQYVAMARTHLPVRPEPVGASRAPSAESVGKGEAGGLGEREGTVAPNATPLVPQTQCAHSAPESTIGGRGSDPPSRMSTTPLVGEASRPKADSHRNCSPNEALSPMLSFILLTSNALRVLYWALVHFEISLLLQSGVVIVMQVALIELIVRKRREFRAHASPGSGPRDLFGDVFWYGLASVGILFAFSAATLLGALYVLLDARISGGSPDWDRVSLLAEAVGYAALLSEATVCMPQMVRNWRMPDTACAGLRWELVACWVLGDAVKTVVVWVRKAPMPFIVSGVVQVAVDSVIVGQMVHYRMTHKRTRVVLAVPDASRAPSRRPSRSGVDGFAGPKDSTAGGLAGGADTPREQANREAPSRNAS